jgi:hypothetical protein
LVIIETVKQDEGRFMSEGIFIAPQYIENMKLVRGRVLSIGPKAQNEGLAVGDEILYDKTSIFSLTGITARKGTEKEGDLVITKIENVIGLVEGHK